MTKPAKPPRTRASHLCAGAIGVLPESPSTTGKTKICELAAHGIE
jgi:hypothetical protein